MNIIEQFLNAANINREKKFERKKAEGRIGIFVAWKDRMKRPLTESSFNEYIKPFGRLSNKVYEKFGIEFKLYRKFKNSTKAKKFMKGL